MRGPGDESQASLGRSSMPCPTSQQVTWLGVPKIVRQMIVLGELSVCSAVSLGSLTQPHVCLMVSALVPSEVLAVLKPSMLR